MTRDEANRANAQLSTGPTTPEGKARSAQNARKHGLLSRAAVMPDDDPATFATFADALLSELRPEGAQQELLADRVVCQAWRLRRAVMLDGAMWSYERDSAARDLAGRSAPHALGIAVKRSVAANAPFMLSRYETAIERSMFVALAELRRLQAERPAHGAPAVAEVIDGEGVPVVE